MFRRLVDGLRRWIATLALKLLVRRGQAATLSMRDCWLGVRSCLVCWPDDGVDAAAAETVLNRLRERFPEARVTLLALPGVDVTLPSDASLTVIQVEKPQLNLLGLPVKPFREMLRGIGADLAIDLAPSFNPLAGYICELSGARIKVGFAGPQGDLVYNYQVAPGPGRSGIERYQALARYIG